MFKLKLPKWETIVSKAKQWTSTAFNMSKRGLNVVGDKVALAIKATMPYIEGLAMLMIGLVYNLKYINVRTVAAALVFVTCLSVPVVAYAAEMESAVEVSYNGSPYGFVADMSEAERVKETVRTSIYGGFDASKFVFDDTTVNEDKITSADVVSLAVIEGVDGVQPACGLYVDSVLKAVGADFAELNGILSQGIAHYTADGSVMLGFANNVELREIYVTSAYAERRAASFDALVNGRYGVQFATTRVETYEQETEFSETVKYDKNKKTSYKKITQKGKNGIVSVTANVSYINGVKVNSEELESVVVKEPKEQITVIGTKKTPVYYSGYVLATKIMTGKAEMVFPVDCKGKTYISSFWGDGRGHKGLDIAAPKNTNIYAAADGVVTYAGRRSDYGYMIIVKHNDGKTETVYSHNAKNLVKVGEAVKAGQHIAEVGATGNATGYHLHFEVRINGKAVDAAPYVGLR